MSKLLILLFTTLILIFNGCCAKGDYEYRKAVNEFNDSMNETGLRMQEMYIPKTYNVNMRHSY